MDKKYVNLYQNILLVCQARTGISLACSVNYTYRNTNPRSEKKIFILSRLIFRHRASSLLGQAFRFSPENAFYIFNQQIYFIIWYLLDRASLI